MNQWPYFVWLAAIGTIGYFLGPWLALVAGPVGYLLGPCASIALGLALDLLHLRTALRRLRVSEGSSSAVLWDALPLYVAGTIGMPAAIPLRALLLVTLVAIFWLCHSYLIQRCIWWSNGSTPLHRAARSGSVEAVQRALEAGGSPWLRDNRGWTAFHVPGAGTPVLRALLHHQASLPGFSENASCVGGERGVRMRDRMTVAALRDQRQLGSLLSAERDEPQLHVWVLNRDSMYARRMLLGEPIPQPVAGFPGSAFRAPGAAPHAGARSAISRADANGVDADGWTSLHEAVYVRHEALVELLLGFAANVNAADAAGWTPLHLASFLGYDNIVRVLLKAGSSALAPDSEGRTPSDLASQSRHGRVAMMLSRRIRGSRR